MYDIDGLSEIKTKRETFRLNYLLHCEKFNNTKLLYIRKNKTSKE